MTDQQAKLTWRDNGTPVSTLFDDPYYSLDNGVEETGHVFLSGNDLPARFCDGLHIAELGFGTGLNFLVTLAAWRSAQVSGRMRFTSFEAYPMCGRDMRTALVRYPDLPSAVFDGIEDQDTIPCRITGPDFELRVIPGDARQTVPKWDGLAHVWYLDGFSPAKNPEMWNDDLMAEVAHHTRPGGTFATYTAAGHVRRALQSAGFDVNRVSGFGRKRHMSRGVKR